MHPTFLILVLTATLATGQGNRYEATTYLNGEPVKEESYQLIFPLEATAPHANLVAMIPRPLSEMSLCYWARLHRDIEDECGVIFSYSVDAILNDTAAAMCSGGRGVRFHRHQEVFDILFSLVPYTWVHVCTTWSAITSKWQVYINDQIYRTGYINSGFAIQPGGVVTIGAVQDDAGEGYESEVLKGQVTELNLWDYVLSSKDVSRLANCTFPHEGNVIAWSEAMWEMYNGARFAPVRLPCFGKPMLHKQYN
uniref:Pentraxin (PTX) domain-containing protein n=1 Tax=Strigamia maritima TaxID=126957 RepID=T1IGV2_STRMM